MAMLRLWTPTPQAPRRCSTSDTVPMMCSTTGSLFWKKPLRKGGSCPWSRLPWGRQGRWDEGSRTCSHPAHWTKNNLRFSLHCPSPEPYTGPGTYTAPEYLPSCLPTPLGSPQRDLCL